MPSHANQHVKLTIGRNVSRVRRERELTQRQLATMIGVDTMQVSRWERGETRPSALHESRLAEVLFDGDIAALYAESTPEAA